MHTMEEYRGNINISPLIPIRDTRWRLMVSLMPWLLYPQEKITWCPLNGRLGGLLTWAGHFGEELSSLEAITLFPLLEFETLYRAVDKLIASYNKSQQDALFLEFILIKNSTCFGQIYCPSSGVSTLYRQQ